MKPVLLTLCLYGEIGLDVKAADVQRAVTAAGAQPILCRINSIGGSMWDAYAIFNSLSGHAPGVEVEIDGIAASAASYIAMAGKVVRMNENALIMIHNPNVAIEGGADELRNQADLLDKVKASIVTAYAGRTKKTPADISALMDAETYMTAEEAKALGIIDEITAPMAVAARADFGKVHLKKPVLMLASVAELRASLGKANGDLHAVTTERDALTGRVAAAEGKADTAESTVTAQATALKAGLSLDDAALAKLRGGDASVIAPAIEALATRRAITMAASQHVPPVPHKPGVSSKAEEVADLLKVAASITDPTARAIAHAAARARIHGKN